ncbi:MAG: DinB family protein [Gemmatimonadaceae bacterium]
MSMSAHRNRHPRAAPDTAESLDEQLVATGCAARAIVGGLTAVQFNWRPAAARWSVGEHLAHLNLVDASYLPHLDAMLARTAVAARTTHPARPRRLGAWLVRATEPPVRLKVRTARRFVPASRRDAPALDPGAVLAEFASTRQALRERLARASGRDLDAIQARYTPGLGPARFVVLSLGQWFALTAAHDRRHLWSAERVTHEALFPRPMRVAPPREHQPSPTGP